MALTDNLVAYYKADESSGNLADSSGNGYTLTNTGGTFVSALIGNGWDSGNAGSGNNAKISNNLGINDTGSWSIVAWVKLKTNITTGSWTFVQHQGTYNNEGFRYDYNSGTYRLAFVRVRNGILDDSINYTHTLSTSSFEFLAITYNSSNTTLIGYLNGSNVVSNSSTPNSAGTSNIGPIFMLNHSFAAASGSEVIDGVGMWSRALSSTEITTLYNSGAGLQYPFTTTVNSNFFNLF